MNKSNNNNNNLFLVKTISMFPLRKSNVVFFVFWYLVKEYKFWKQGTNTAPIVLLSANQNTDIISC